MQAAGGTGDPAPARIVLTPDPTPVAKARAFVRDCCLLDGVDPDVGEAAVLLTSEVVTNAFLHGRSQGRLEVTINARSVLVEVGDDNSRPPHRSRQDSRALDGRGLMILDALAQDWGVRPTDLGKIVWFRLAAAS